MARGVALCPKCPHEVREHQPVKVGRHNDDYVACQACDCLITMRQKLAAWGGRRK